MPDGKIQRRMHYTLTATDGGYLLEFAQKPHLDLRELGLFCGTSLKPGDTLVFTHPEEAQGEILKGRVAPRFVFAGIYADLEGTFACFNPIEESPDPGAPAPDSLSYLGFELRADASLSYAAPGQEPRSIVAHKLSIPRETPVTPAPPVASAERDQQVQKVRQAMTLIRDAAEAALEKARNHYGISEPAQVEIDFSLRGKMAGQAGWRLHKVGRKKRAGDFRLRVNLEAYLLNPQEMLTDTVPHEVAHLVVAARFGPGPKPHGAEWQEVMRACFGLTPQRTHCLPLTAARLVERRFIYTCKCREHRLTSIRHQRIRRGKSTYRCKTCGETLRFQDQLL